MSFVENWDNPDTQTSTGSWNSDEDQDCIPTGDQRRYFFKRGRRDKNEGHHHEPRKNIKQKTIVKVPSYKVGKVIGRQGTKIRELQSTTRTRIYVGEEDSDGEVEICISGPTEGKVKCREMILRLVQEPTFESSMRQAAEKKKEDTFYHIDWDAVNKIADECEKRRWKNLIPLKKNFYVEAPDVACMTEEYVEELRSLNNMQVNYPFGGNRKIPNPVETFHQAFACYPELLDMLFRQKFTKPFPIQCQAWPILLTGLDMIGVAQTGTGKTLAFLLPAFIHTYGQEVALSERGGPNVLILAPTRELALQIDGEAKRFQYRDLKSVCLYGGGEREDQIRELGKGVQMVIATPGRLNELISLGILSIESVTFLVLDEADRMLDMGFERQIRRILLSLRPDRQTIMTSATWPYVIQNLAEKYMKEPLKVVIGSTDLAAVHSVSQTILVVKEENKLYHLLDVVSNMSPNDKMIIFVGKRTLADSLACDLILRKVECQSIHGSRDQRDREQAIDDLKTGAVRILVATDVASRGIDIVDVTKVVNYDFPRNIEEYVHRVGRTGRAGKTGEAISFFTTQNSGHAKDLIAILKEANQVVPEKLLELSEEYEGFQGRVKSDKCLARRTRSSAYRNMQK